MTKQILIITGGKPVFNSYLESEQCYGQSCRFQSGTSRVSSNPSHDDGGFFTIFKRTLDPSNPNSYLEAV